MLILSSLSQDEAEEYLVNNIKTPFHKYSLRKLMKGCLLL